MRKVWDLFEGERALFFTGLSTKVIRSVVAAVCIDVINDMLLGWLRPVERCRDDAVDRVFRHTHIPSARTWRAKRPSFIKRPSPLAFPGTAKNRAVVSHAVFLAAISAVRLLFENTLICRLHCQSPSFSFH